MANTKDVFLQQLESILSEYQIFVNKCKYDDLSDRKDTTELAALITKSTATIERITTNNSEYYKSIKIAYDPNNKRQYSHPGYVLIHIIGIIKALKSDLENDYLKSLSEIIHANLFSDYIEMASHLLEEGYKDPAAVLIGSTIENHLKKLCKKHKIEIEYENNKGKIIHKKADSINSELTKNNVYNKIYQKQITAWLGLRNNAAHGNYQEYGENEVKLMIAGVLNFINSYPA